MTNDLEIAIQNFRNTAGRYQRYERYYAGRHDLSFATEKFQPAFGSMFREFAMNLCPAIVDATLDKLKIQGFGVAKASRHGLHVQGPTSFQPQGREGVEKRDNHEA